MLDKLLLLYILATHGCSGSEPNRWAEQAVWMRLQRSARIDALQPHNAATLSLRRMCAMTRGGGRAFGTGFSVVISVGSASLSCPSSLAQVSPQQHAK